MKTTSIVSLTTVLCASIAFAAEADTSKKQLQSYPKNLARQHVGSNLFLFNPTSQTFVQTEAAAAWLDDDVSTGWPAMAGQQHYLLSLAEPELITNFSVSARPASGTVTIYAGDEPAPPSAKSWTVITRDVPFESINDKKLAKPFSKLAKYVLIETNIADPGPVFSLHVYGEKPAVDFDLRQRDQPIDPRGIFGKYLNNQTTFNVDGLYANARVDYANTPEGFVGWQKAIDDNPESSLKLLPSTSEAGAVIKYDHTKTISRISLQTDSAKGKLDFYALPETALGGSQKPVAIDNMTPTVSIVLDGSNPRSSIDFPPVQAAALAVRWSPVSPTDSLTVREVNSFSTMTLADSEVSLSPEAIAEFGPDSGSDPSKDGKAFVDNKNPKEVALGPNAGSPYLPGSLGFPPNLTSNRVPPLPPQQPLSP